MTTRWIAVCLCCVLASFSQATTLSEQTYSNWVDADGSLLLPDYQRTDWAHLGSWIIRDEAAPGYGFHDVYMQAEALRHFRQTGQFADGTVIIKEVRHIRSGIKTTGAAEWAGDITIWFVMIRDRRGRFRNDVHWASGWGWALFKTSDKRGNISSGFEQSCKGCHLPAQATDWVFTEGYPSLF